MDEGGGLTTRRGKGSEDEPSGEGGLLLTSRKVDRASRGETTRGETTRGDSWTPSTGPGWNLAGSINESESQWTCESVSQ